MRRQLTVLAVCFALVMVAAATRPANAQDGGTQPTPSPAAVEDRLGVVTGQLDNGTGGAAEPGSLALMLHAWDDTGETVMLEGQSDASGAYRFDEVPMRDGWVFGVMINYAGATYFSEFTAVEPGATELELPVTVYETTTDTASVRVSQLHTFLDFVDGRMMVAEVYVVSNLGDRTVWGGMSTGGEPVATLQFGLPDDAEDITFDGDDAGERLLLAPGGFVDFAPLAPGEGSAQVVVTFWLPYEPGMNVAHSILYPVEAQSFLVRADAGVTLAAPGIGEGAITSMGHGGDYTVYPAAAIPAGGSYEVTVSGEPAFAPQSAAGADAEAESAPAQPTLAQRLALPIGGAALGLVLIGAGAWWLQRSRRPTTAPANGRAAGIALEGSESGAAVADWDQLLQQIAQLDDAHERGEVDEAAYAEQRSSLKAQARAALQKD